MAYLISKTETGSKTDQNYNNPLWHEISQTLGFTWFTWRSETNTGSKTDENYLKIGQTLEFIWLT